MNLRQYAELQELARPIHEDHRTLPLDLGYPLRPIVETAISRLNLPQNFIFKMVRFDGQRALLDTPEAQAALDQEIAATDDRCHQEARSIPGFVVYSPGDLDDFGFATSWCLWESWEAAKQARTLEGHAYAMAQVKRYYRCINFSRYLLRLDNDRTTGVQLSQLHNHARPRSYAST